MSRLSRSLLAVLAVLAALAGLVGCGGKMRSNVRTGPYEYDNPRRSAVEIVGVNGNNYRGGTVYLEPGAHTILAVISPRSPRGPTAPMAMSINVEPCTSYYLAAESPTSVRHRWTIVLDRAIPIEGCISKTNPQPR